MNKIKSMIVEKFKNKTENYIDEEKLKIINLFLASGLLILIIAYDYIRN
jgi:hypothetical protein